ncbi:hypothetical protein K402DRAFT_263634 [Aulographum hederae CBS 113979]|uniref:Heterokaryon incompatibility domain-containing protein n=1 Tax=Aulographum hederae CBS 113979 TaxID=1176131 RepID=A0A6G1HA13_9PEZI|nr:hypothetical protein K402DRAFT_263634 [Aulographum hederae CBS 113979]
MAATYSWADRVLVLDHELSSMESPCPNIEKLSRIAVCGWNSRCWTFQKYCLANETVFQGRDGQESEKKWIHSCHRRNQLSRYSLEIVPTFFYRESPLEDVIYHDLLDLSISIPTAEYGQDRCSKCTGSAFQTVWNRLANRTSTKMEDILGIFALLLDCNPAEVIRLSARDQMKAILATQTSLPIELLFINILRYTDHQTPEDSWIPISPVGGECFPGSRSLLMMELKRTGLCMQACSHCSDITFWEVKNPRVNEWPVGTNSAHVSNVETEDLFLDFEALEHTSTPPHHDGPLLFILDKTKRHFGMGRGTCLFLTTAVGNDISARYGFPIRWSKTPQSSRHTKHVAPHLRLTAERFSSCKNIILECDIANWPKMEKRQVFIFRSLRAFSVTLVWFIYAAFQVLLALWGALFAEITGLLAHAIFTAVLVFVGLSSSSCWCSGVEGRQAISVGMHLDVSGAVPANVAWYIHDTSSSCSILLP